MMPTKTLLKSKLLKGDDRIETKGEYSAGTPFRSADPDFFEYIYC